MGLRQRGIWVDKGCRADFSFGRDDGGRNGGGGGGNWDRPGTLTCESISYRYRYCNANTQDRVNLTRELSTGNLCRQGSGWGYDGGGIWVDRGCRAEFRYGRDNSNRNDAALAAGIIGALAIGAAIGSAQAHRATTAATAANDVRRRGARLVAAAGLGDRLVSGVRR